MFFFVTLIAKSYAILYNVLGLKGNTYFREMNMMYVKPGSSEMIRLKLLEEMKNGSFSECERLPRETVLSEKLGISRTQLRDVLSGLEREGFITRRQGIGTLINRHVLQVKNRMDIETEFLDIIRQNGYEPEMSFVKVTEDSADEAEAEKLRIPVGAPLIRIRVLCTADGNPAIYTEDVLAKSLVKVDFKARQHQMIVFQFLKEFCEVEPYLDLTELHPRTADEKLSELLKVPVGTTLLNMEEVDYDIEGNPVFYSRQHFVDGFFRHTVLRKKL